MTLQKEYELVCQIFNDNFKVENDNDEFKRKVFMNPSMWISASHIIGQNNANLAELLFNVREKINKKKISNFSILKNYIKNKAGFIYADTDSIHCDLPKNIKGGVILTETTFELKERKI